MYKSGQPLPGDPVQVLMLNLVQNNFLSSSDKSAQEVEAVGQEQVSSSVLPRDGTDEYCPRWLA